STGTAPAACIRVRRSPRGPTGSASGSSRGSTSTSTSTTTTRRTRSTTRSTCGATWSTPSRRREGGSVRNRLPLIALVLGLAAGCATNPATGERQLMFVSEAQERELGAQSDQQIVAQFGVLPESDPL